MAGSSGWNAVWRYCSKGTFARLFNRSNCFQCSAIRSLPTGVNSTLVLGFLFTNRFSIRIRPPSSSFAKWLERLPLVNPEMRWRKIKSAEDYTVMIAGRRALTRGLLSAIRLPRSPP